MPGRTRSRVIYGDAPGLLTYHLSGTTVIGRNPTGYESISDVTGEGNGQPLNIRKVRQTGGIINGNGTFSTEFQNYRADALQDVASALGFWIGVDGEPGLGESAAKLLADTNPSRPVVDLPLYLFELKDIPGMLRNEGDTFLRSAAHANLSWQFGWAPLLNDLKNLFDFHDQVEKRSAELRNLYDSGLRRKRKVWSGVHHYSETRYLQSDGMFIPARYDTACAIEHIGFVKWFPTTLPPRSNTELRSLARRAVLGLTIDLSTAWNAIPWSWLVDWCSSTGDFIAAHRNIIPAEHGPIQMMRHSAFEANTKIHQYNPNISDHYLWVEGKERHIVTPTISAHLPFLSLRQLSILGSIGVTRRVPRS